MKSVITVLRDPRQEVNEDFARIYGQPPPNPIYFRHENGKEYSSLVGGIGWPVLGKQPGCVLIIGATRDEPPSFEVLDESFSENPRDLLKACIELRDKYGFREYSKVFNNWIGEDLFESLLLDINKKEERGVYITPPPDFSLRNHDEIYIDQIRTITAEGRLVIHCPAVLDNMKAMTILDAKKPLGDTPVVAVICYILHEMLTGKPWVTEERVVNMDDYDGLAAF